MGSFFGQLFWAALVLSKIPQKKKSHHYLSPHFPLTLGKTHTMEGDLSDPIKFGVIPRSSDAIFGALRNGKFESFRVTVSYLEIYNEDLCDLLTEPTSSTKLEIMNKKSGTFCR